MQCEQLNERWPDYWAGWLSEPERAEIEAHVASCAECRQDAAELGETWRALGMLPDETPSPALAQRFEAMLDAWREGQHDASAARDRQSSDARVAKWDEWRRRGPAAQAAREASTGDASIESIEMHPHGARREAAAGRRSWMWQPAWQLAAAVLLLIAGFAAGRTWPDTAAREELVELRGELRGTREIVALSLLQQESAIERLRGVNWSHSLDRPSERVLGQLLDTLAHDANDNVRLASIDALRGFATQAHVRDGLLVALRQQPSPLVQIALIDTMVEIRERRSVDLLRTLVADRATNEAVRQRARRGLQQLSS